MEEDELEKLVNALRSDQVVGKLAELAAIVLF